MEASTHEEEEEDITYSSPMLTKLTANERIIQDTRQLLFRCKLLKSELHHEQNVLSSKLKSLNDLRQSREKHEITNKMLVSLISNDKQHIDNIKKGQLIESNKKLNTLWSQTYTRRRKLLHDLTDIFPIIEFPDKKGGYSICDIYLPSSEDFDGHDEKMVSIAIGYVGQLLVMLSSILDIPLRYQIKNLGSRSLILYDYSIQHYFPLYIESFKSREWKEFSNGVFLLNQNIVQFRSLYGLTTRDARDTLSNIHDLIYDQLLTSGDSATKVTPLRTETTNELNELNNSK